MGKKILIFLLATVFIFTIEEKVYAGDINTNGGSVSVPVKYTADTTSFVITVPTVIWAAKEATSFEITAKKINLRPDEQIQVFIASGCNANSRIVLERQGAVEGAKATLETEARIGGKTVAANNYRVGCFKDSADSKVNLDGAVTLSGLKVDQNTRAGDYQSVICFRVELGANGN